MKQSSTLQEWKWEDYLVVSHSKNYIFLNGIACNMSGNNRNWSNFHETLNRETEEIRIVNSSLTDSDFGEIVEQILNFQRSNNHELNLKKLYLQRNKLTHRSIRYLGILLQQLRTIEIIELGDNKIGNKGLEHLSSHLSRYFAIKKIFLYQNSITNIAPFVKILRSGMVQNLRQRSYGTLKRREQSFEDVTHHVITEINFNLNNLGDRGVQLLLEALKKSICFQTLEILGISDCGITDKGLIPFFTSFLSNNPSLLSVDLSRNAVTKRCLNAILNVSRDNNIRLINLNLPFESDQSRFKYQTEFNEVVFKRNKTILTIELFLNDIREKRKRDVEVRQRLRKLSKTRYLNMISKVREFDFNSRKDMSKVYEGYYGSIKRVNVVDRELAVKRVLFERLINSSESLPKDVIYLQGEKKFLNNAKILKKMNHKNVIDFFGKLMNRDEGEGYLFFSYHEMTLNRWLEFNFTHGKESKEFEVIKGEDEEDEGEEAEEEKEGEGSKKKKRKGDNRTDMCHPKFLKDTIRDIDILLQICSGMRYIHSLGYVHRDLKPSNILLQEVSEKVKEERNLRRMKNEKDAEMRMFVAQLQQKRKKMKKKEEETTKPVIERGPQKIGDFMDFTCKIIDFDFAVDFERLGETFSIRGSPGFVAPDLVIQGSPLDKHNLLDFSRKIDIYSFGICMFCVLFKQSESRTFQPPGKGVFPDQWSLTKFISESGWRPMVIQFPFDLEYVMMSKYKSRIDREFERNIKPALASGRSKKLVFQKINEFMEREKIARTVRSIQSRQGNATHQNPNATPNSSSSSSTAMNSSSSSSSNISEGGGGGSGSGGGGGEDGSGEHEHLDIGKILKEEIEKLFPQKRKKSSFLSSSSSIGKFETTPELVDEFHRRVWIPVLSDLFFKSIVIDKFRRVWESTTKRMSLVSDDDIFHLFSVVERYMFPQLYTDMKKKRLGSLKSSDSLSSSPGTPTSSPNSPGLLSHVHHFHHRSRTGSLGNNSSGSTPSAKRKTKKMKVTKNNNNNMVLDDEQMFLIILREEYEELKEEIQKKWDQLVKWNFPIYMRLPNALLLLMSECWDQDPSKRPSTFAEIHRRLRTIRKEVVWKEEEFIKKTKRLKREMVVFEDVREKTNEFEKMDRFYSNEIKTMNRQIKELQKKIKLYKREKVENNNKSFQNKKLKKKVEEKIRRMRNECENVFHKV